MRSIFLVLTIVGLLIAKDVNYKIQNLAADSPNLVSVYGITQDQQDLGPTRSSRDDTTTVWLEDFEGDETWEAAPEWELTEESSYSPTHSYHMDDDNYDVVSSIISPLLSIDELGGANEMLKMNFALWCDFPDWDGDGDNYLEDYYWVDIANVSDVPVYFHETSSDAYEGQSWWCADPGVGGYLDAWVQMLQSPTITLPAMDPSMSVMMKWGIEDPAGATVGGTCTDGWDAANVRISADGGTTWSLLEGDDPYDFEYGYGWIYNDDEYDCGGSLEFVASGWGGQADWHEITFSLNEYAGQDVIIQFAFGSDPAYSTPDDNTLTGFILDNIVITAGNGDVAFIDNADDENHMIPMNGLEYAWEQFFYDYGDITRPGALGWEVYQPGSPFNGNAQLDISAFAGSDIRIRFTGRTDADDNGGNGEGLFIDDVHIWKVSYNDVPMVENLEAVGLDNQVLVTWDMPPGGSYTNEEISFVDGSFEDAIWMTSGTSVMGEYFDMPYGVTAIYVHSSAVWGDASAAGATTLYGYNVQAGVPQPASTFSVPITLVADQWNTVDLGWTFEGDFVLAIEVSTTVAIAIDADASPSQHSWANLGGWEPWSDIAGYYGLTDGEFGITANVTTAGGIEPVFNIYRSMNGGDFNMMFNGEGLNESEYTDNMVQNGNEYCYEVTAIYDEEESDPSEPACAIPEAQTIYEIAFDDGTAETSINAGNTNFLCVKFTPSGYPADLYRASYFTVGTSNGVGFVNVWDDDGENGMPGTVLVDNVPVTFIGETWTQVALSSYNVTIEEGSFYVGWWEMAQTPPIGVDSDNPGTNSYIDVGIGLGWEPFTNYFDGALMIRAELDSVNALGLEDDLSGNIPVSFGLNQNYPNPFNPTTTIEFDLASKGYASLVIYDLTGREVMDLVNQNLDAGHYAFKLNAVDLPSGMYFYQLIANNDTGDRMYSSTKKLILMK